MDAAGEVFWEFIGVVVGVVCRSSLLRRHDIDIHPY
jgi:hypothetical protein